MRRLVLTAVAVVGLIAVGAIAGTAKAARPTVEPIEYSFVDDESCPGTAIEVNGTGRVIIYEETEDTFVAHFNIYETDTANGKTVVNNQAYNVRFTDNVARFTGTVFNIQAPGAGNVLTDAGILIFDADSGEVLFEGGPHPAYRSLQSLCDYFSDP
jgi:hypothetical protein